MLMAAARMASHGEPESPPIPSAAPHGWSGMNDATSAVSANPVSEVAHATVNNPGLRFLARTGYVASGILHALIGLLAIGVARGFAATEADQSGALAQVAATPGGVFVLWILVIGLAALGFWLVVRAFLSRRADPKKRVLHFVNDFAKGVAYLVLSLTALIFALGGSTRSNSSTSDLSAHLMSAPGGVFAVAAAGAVVFGVGVYSDESSRETSGSRTARQAKHSSPWGSSATSPRVSRWQSSGYFSSSLPRLRTRAERTASTAG
jgi:hypothetical protein